MYRDDIKKYIDTSSNKSIIIYRKNSSTFPGFVKTIEFKEGIRVLISYDTYGYDEGGVYYEGEYPSLDDAIKSIEAYIGLDISDWDNVTKDGSYPDLPSGITPGQDAEKLKDGVINASVSLPTDTKFQIKSGYWKNLIEEQG